ncbi:MAG TPA: 3-oxoacyl-[acyl-carrier-protein] reductase [Thermoanaerobaculia bacterium]|nr:3-oxoacyl-[acyl-carrier-protein] reductase [Thermoanaerobaculia bacterium]
MNIDLTGRIALVTGASRGIGEGVARRLAATGAMVLCAARNEDQVKTIADSIQSDGGKAAGIALDIAGPDVREKVKELIARHERIDILVNNAGVTQDDLFIRMKQEAWDTVLTTNLDAMFAITQEVVKKMIRTRWGRIINISSVVGLMGNPGQVNYAASKAGIIGFTKALALEIGSRNVTVNAIAPGFIETAMTGAMTAEAKEGLESKIAMKRLGTVDDVAFATVFLASEQASYITGTVMNVSGGMYV